MNYFKKVRETSRLSQDDVSKNLGHKTPQLISNIERGISVYPMAAIPKVAELFNVSESELKQHCYEFKLKKLKKAYGIK